MGSYYTSCRRCGAEVSGRYDSERDGENTPGDDYAEVKESRARHEGECPCLKYEKALRLVEWVDEGPEPWCPCCRNWKSMGHRTNCQLPSLLPPDAVQDGPLT